MYTLGIDIGSSSSKAVILKDGAELISSAVVQVGTGTSGPGRVMEDVFKDIDLKPEDIDFTVATGYGRFSVENADKQISEITCHAKGIYYLVPAARTIIDIGGQDAKAIQLDGKGNILKFVMNDKCAAGTGRFLDVMSRVLEVPLSEMGEAHLKRISGHLSAVHVLYLLNQKLFLSYLKELQKKASLPAYTSLLPAKPAHWYTVLGLLTMWLCAAVLHRTRVS